MANINDWLSIDKASGTGNAYITLTASSSTELQERIASLSVKTRSKEVFLNVKQLAFNNYFVLGKNLISPLWEGGSYSNYTLSNISWTYTSSDWISLSVTSGSVGRTEFNVVVQPNTSEETRIGFVNIVASNGVIMGTIKVAQASHNEVNNIIFYTSTDGKKITPYSSTGVVANEYVDGVGALYYANTITEVPQDLFRNTNTLASVSVPETVTTIKSGAFYNCHKLASYDFPDALTTIEASAFRYCDSLAIFDFPYVETIGDYAFNECSFETVILSDTLKTTGKGTFQTCTKLKTIQIGSGLTSISAYLCQNCTSLETVNMPTNIKRIEQGAFKGCTAIEALNLHGSIEYIGESAFGENKIKSITLGERTSALENGEKPFFASTPYIADAHITDIKSWLLWKPSLLTNENSVRNLYVNEELLTEVITPSDYDIVPDYAFYNNPHITQVVVTDNVTSVGKYAFSGLNNANYLYLGSGASYSSNTFTDFDGTLELNNTNSEVLGNNYFTKVVFMSNTTNVVSSSSTKEVEFRGDVLSVGTSTVNVLRNVTRVVINCNQLHIGNNLFLGASLLTELDFSKVVSIGSSSFEETSITELTNAPLLTSIGNEGFKNTKLKTVDLSNSPLTSIGNYVFKDCTELTEMILPSLSYTIGNYAFENCSKLKHIKIVTEDIIETEEREIAKLSNSVYNTGIDATVNSRLEFDYKYTQSPSGDAYYEVIGAGNTDNDNVFQIRIYGNTFYFHIGSSQVTLNNITSNVFHHFVVSLNEGVIIDGVSKGTFSRSDKTINAPFYINGIQYSSTRHANGEFGTIKIDDNVITPKEDGFYNGSTKLDVVKSGEYEYKKEIIILNAPAIPTVTNYTFYNIVEYGFLEYPLGLDFSSWLSTNSYYLGYYKWNRLNISASELDFDAADTYEVTINNGIPSTWEITHLPFWLTASVMSGGEGTTTITFTKTVDYVETDDIIISIMGANYVIKAKYAVRTLDFTKQDTYVLNISNTTSITDVDWLTETFDTETVTLTLGAVYTAISNIIIIKTPIGDFKVNAIADGSETPLPKADNRIYYIGDLSNYKYNTNGNFAGEGSIGGGCYYKEYDRPIIEVGDMDLTRTERVSLPSTLLYINDRFGSNSDILREVDFGGSEIYIGSKVFNSCEYLNKYNLPQTLTHIGSCSLGGQSNKVSTMGAEIVNIGADMREFNACVFNGCGNIKRVNFWGEIPPIFYRIDCMGESSASFENVSAEFHIPVGTKSAYDEAVKIITDVVYIRFDFIDDLEAKPKTDYGENKLFMGTEKNILKPFVSNRVIGYWNSSNKIITYFVYGNDGNSSNETKEYSKTINGITFTYDVRGNGFYSSCTISGRKSSKTYYYDYTATLKNLYGVSFKCEDYLGRALSLSSNSYNNGTYRRVYSTNSATVAHNYVKVILNAEDYYGSKYTQEIVMDNYEDKYPYGSAGWR